MIAFIDAYRDRFSVEFICQTLNRERAGGFLSSRGYRAANTRAPSARSFNDAVLTGEIAAIFEANYRVYGVRKMWHALKRAGWTVGREQVARLMRTARIRGVRRGRAPIEVKLGGSQIDEAARHLSALRDRVDTQRMGEPSFLAVLTAGRTAYRRDDGVLVVPLACLTA